MDFTKVKYAVDEKVAIISMDSPKNMNAFDEVMLDELCEAFKMAEENKDIKAILLNSSTDKAFSAGGDVGSMYEGLKQCNGDKAMFAGEFGKSIAKMANVTKAILTSAKPVVGAIQGACAGAGVGVALACDYTMATQASVFMTAFSKLGLIPDAGGVYLLTRAVGLKKATELAMDGGQMVFADDAKALGMLNEVIEDDDAFADAALKRAKKFTYGPANSYSYIKKLVWESEFLGFDEFVKHEVDGQMACGATDDFEEGVCAFVEKRRASFK
ncbi:MAG: enoyl-CoA hydratase/isomerase family protein [Oscillospiraceae bacterium]